MDTELVIGGIQLAVIIVLFVQTLKFLGLTDEKWLKLAPVFVAGFFTLLWGAEQLAPVAAPYIKLFTLGIVGMMSAVLGYGYAVKPIGEALGLRISAKDVKK